MGIKVAITDDHPMIISGIENLISGASNMFIVGTYTTSAALLDGLKNEIPDVLLLDIHLPDKTGDKLVPVIQKKYPTIQIIILTNLDSAFYIHNLITKGVSGYLLKKSDGNVIVDAIQTVYNGGKYISLELKDKFTSFSDKIKHRETMLPSLTQKEKAVLKLTMEGCTLQEISDQLYLGRRTVEYYRSNLLLKLDVKNMASLIRKAVEMGLLD